MRFLGSNEDHTTPIENINNDHVEENVVLGGQETGRNEEQFTIPRQVEWPDRLVDAMMNITKNILSNTNDQILDIPSQPGVIINNEHVSYYIDDGGEEEHPMDTKEQEGEDNANETPAPIDPLGNTPY